MRSVNIAELKNKLSAYIRYAKAGETIVVRDRNLPVAKLTPFVAEGASEEDLALVAAGHMRLAESPLGIEYILSLPPGIMSPEAEARCAATQAVFDDREEGY
jgi:prevent-host-death family protein